MTIRRFADEVGMEAMKTVEQERPFYSITSESELRINMSVAIFMEYAKHLHNTGTHLFTTLKNEVFSEAVRFANNNASYIDKGSFIKRIDEELDLFKMEMTTSKKNNIKNRFAQFMGTSVLKKRFQSKDDSLQNEFVASVENVRSLEASNKQNALCNLYYDECMSRIKKSCSAVALNIF